jgi:predicted MFS family arabinose efflux permease
MRGLASAAEPRRFPVAAMLVPATITFTAITTELMPSGLLPQSANVRKSAPYVAVILVTVISAARLLTGIPRKTMLVSFVLTLARKPSPAPSFS